MFGINSYELPKKVCQNSDKAIKEVESKNADNCSCQNSDKPMPDNSQSVDFIENIDDDDEEFPIPRSENIYERAEQALKLTEAFHKKSPEIKPIDTKRELAQIAGVSHDTIERVKTIQGKAPEEVLQKLRDSEISINQAYTTIKREEKKQKRNEEVKENTAKVN